MSIEIISKQEAQVLGRKRYFTGRPCKHGHIAERTIDSCTCTECNRLNSEKWNNKNREVKRELWRRWYSKNKSKSTHKERLRRAKLYGAEGTHTEDHIKSLLSKQKNKCMNCLACVKRKYHVDHIIALSNGGSNWPDNLQILCPSCNAAKRNKTPEEWARYNQRLL